MNVQITDKGLLNIKTLRISIGQVHDAEYLQISWFL